MNIGLDARSALLRKKGGFGVYSKNLIHGMATQYPEHYFTLFYQNEVENPINEYSNIQVNRLGFPLKTLWTQVRLPLHLINFKPDVFFFIRVVQIAWLFLFFAMIINYTH